MSNVEDFNLLDLNWDILCTISSYLSIKDLFTLRCCSKRCQDLVDNEFLPYLRVLNLADLSKTTGIAESFQVLATNCRNLRRLNLAKCNWLSDDPLRLLLANNSDKLRDVTLSGSNNISASAIQPLITGGSRTLRSLKLSKCYFLTIGALNTIALHQTALVELDISYCNSLSDRSISVLLKSCRQLETLCLAHVTSVTDACLLVAAKHATQLRRLNLIGCMAVSDVGVKALAAIPRLDALMVRGCPRVTEASLALLRGRVHIDQPRNHENQQLVPFPLLYLQV